MTSIFNTYNPITGDVLISPPDGCVSIQNDYNENTLNIVPGELLIDRSTTLHPSKHPVTAYQSCYISNELLSGNGNIQDIYVEQAPDFQKDFNKLLKSNYIEDLEMVTYRDGTRTHNQEILLKAMEIDNNILKQPDVAAQVIGQPDIRSPVHINIKPDREIQQDIKKNVSETNDLMSELTKSIKDLKLSPAGERKIPDEPLKPRPETDQEKIRKELSDLGLIKQEEKADEPDEKEEPEYNPVEESLMTSKIVKEPKMSFIRRPISDLKEFLDEIPEDMYTEEKRLQERVAFAYIKILTQSRVSTVKQLNKTIKEIGLNRYLKLNPEVNKKDIEDFIKSKI